MNAHQTTIEQAAHAVALTRRLLDDSVDQLPHDITERLRAARVQVLAQRPRVVQPAVAHNNGWLGWLQKMPHLAKALIAVPVLSVALVIGGTIHAPNTLSLNSVFDTNAPQPMALMQSNPANDAINIDAILNEKIPLQAYLTDDFNSFIEHDVSQAKVQEPRIQPLNKKP